MPVYEWIVLMIFWQFPAIIIYGFFQMVFPFKKTKKDVIMHVNAYLLWPLSLIFLIIYKIIKFWSNIPDE